MATQTVPHVVPQSKFPVVIRIESQIISQDQLCQIVTLRQQMEALETKLKALEIETRTALESGTEVEPGLLRAHLKTTERRNVSWKSVVEREPGEDYAVRVLAATKPDTYTTLIVQA